jgi:hypothetical protein
MINRTNEKYREAGLALIQKIPTPITPINIDKESRHITLAYFDQKSTVDYIGAVQGVPVCFDAKECAADTIPLQNIHAHQIRFMEENGYAFSYTCYQEIDSDSKPTGVFISGPEHITKQGMYNFCWPGCLTVMYRRETIGLVQIEDIRKNNDTALWLKVIRKAPCYLLPEELARYRRRANSITPKPLWQRIWAHYPLFHVAERMNPIEATFWTLLNVVGNGYKKMFYVQKDN